jgi:hypothetical protein
MEWLVLIFLVPAILVPVVLLWAFAGCEFVPGVAVHSAATDVSAEGISESAIRVTWTHAASNSVTFQIERTKEGQSLPEAVLTSTATTLEDTGLDEATTYSYTVTAFRNSDNEQSEPSDPVDARTIGVAFEADFTTDQTGWEGFCIVQRIEPVRLRQSTLPGDALTPGARVRITVRGSTAGSVTLDRIYISQPATTGNPLTLNPYDSASDLSQVASGVVVPANTAVSLPLIDYDLDNTRPLLIAFDISPNAGTGKLRHSPMVPATDAVMYFRASTVEASINDRASAYVPNPRIYLVEKIEVV